MGLQSARFCPTLFHGSSFEKHVGDHGDDLLCITACQGLTIRGIGRKPLRPVQLAAQPGLSFFDPIHDSVHCGFSCQFSEASTGSTARATDSVFPASCVHLLLVQTHNTRRLDRRLSSTCYTGSSALSVLSHCVDQPRNQCRTALKEVSLKKPSLTHCVGVCCLTRPAPTAFSLLLSTTNAEEPLIRVLDKTRGARESEPCCPE